MIKFPIRLVKKGTHKQKEQSLSVAIVLIQSTITILNEIKNIKKNPVCTYF